MERRHTSYDQSQQLVPAGVTGELYVSGLGVGLGYINDDEKTQQHFFANPFFSQTDNKMYKTGDLVRYLADGNVEFIGRVDNQVKLRGLRIELGEIESDIKQAENIKDALVVVVDDRLVAYLIATQKEDFDESTETQQIKQLLTKIAIRIQITNTSPLVNI